MCRRVANHAELVIGPDSKNTIIDEEGVKSSKASNFWHEIAHPIATLETGKQASNDARSQAAKYTVGFENVARSILGLEKRSGLEHGVEVGPNNYLPGSEGSDSKPFNNFDVKPGGEKSFDIPDDVG